MKLLLDTNIFLEIILDQENAVSAKTLLSSPADHAFFMSDFSLHSIGLLLFRRNQYAVFERFVADVILTAQTRVVGLTSEDMGEVVRIARETRLDFDDAYQCSVARRWSLEIVSFDGDFDRAGVRRLTPAQVVEQ